MADDPFFRRDYSRLWELSPPRPLRPPWGLLLLFAAVVIGVLLFALGAL